MKIVLPLLIAGLCMFPIGEACAAYGAGSAFNKTISKVDREGSKKAQQDLAAISRKQAAAMVKTRYKAKVLSLSSSKVNGNPGYRAKLLDNNGTVFYVYIDATNGMMTRS